MFNIISISWIYWHLFTDIIWSILENVSCVLEIKVYSAAIGWNVVYKSIKSILSNVLLKASVSLFSLAVLSMGSQRLRHNWVTELNCSVHYVTDVLMSLQFSSVAESYLTLCDPMNCSTPGLPVQHQFPEPTQTHVHWVSHAIQPSHPLSSSSPAFNLSQHQGLFQWINSLHQVAKGLEFQPQHQSFQWIFRTDFL